MSTTRAPPAPLINGSAAAIALRVPNRLRRTTASNSAEVVSANSRGLDVPAEHTSASTRPPQSAAACFSAARVFSSLVTSTEYCRMRWLPSATALISATASSRGCALRASSTTCAPRRAASSATALPMPLLPPVTTTTRLRSEKKGAERGRQHKINPMRTAPHVAIAAVCCWESSIAPQTRAPPTAAAAGSAFASSVAVVSTWQRLDMRR